MIKEITCESGGDGSEMRPMSESKQDRIAKMEIGKRGAEICAGGSNM